MKKLSGFRKIVLSLLLIGLSVGQLRPASAFAFDRSAVTSYSTYSMNDGATLLGVKTGEFGLYLNTLRSYTANSYTVASTSGSVTKNNTKTTCYPFANVIVTQSPTSTPVTTTSPTMNAPLSDEGQKTYLDYITPDPSVEPTAAPASNTVSNGNLVANPSFENTTDGWADGWTKDTIDFNVATNSLGNDGTNSLNVGAVGVNAHVWSNYISVDSNSTYTWSQFVKVAQNGEEFGFYIDEYDENNVWLAGKWMGRIENNGTFVTGTKTFTYVPSNTNVKNIRLQYYSVRGNQAVVYIDSVLFTKN